MLKHVEQSVALAAWTWFNAHAGALAVYYEPHFQLDSKFRIRFADAASKGAGYALEVQRRDDPATWSDACFEASFQAVMLFRQALEAVGPSLLRQLHARIGHDSGAPPAKTSDTHGQREVNRRGAPLRPPRPRAVAAAKRQLRAQVKKDFSGHRRLARAAARGRKRG